MKIKSLLILGFCAIALVGTLILTGCCNKTVTSPGPPAGPAEKAGAALDKAVEDTREEASKLADKASDAAGKAVDKTGEVLEDAGAGLEKAGEDMQESQDKATNP